MEVNKRKGWQNKGSPVSSEPRVQKELLKSSAGSMSYAVCRGGGLKVHSTRPRNFWPSGHNGRRRQDVWGLQMATFLQQMTSLESACKLKLIS